MRRFDMLIRTTVAALLALALSATVASAAAAKADDPAPHGCICILYGCYCW